MKITLPTSKYSVELKESLSYGEYKGIEAVMLSGAKGKIIGQTLDQQFDGSVVQLYQRKMIETFVLRASKENGEEVQINLMLNDLPAEDGLKLESEVALAFENIKKKLK